MASRGFIPKVKQLTDVKLDFPEVDEDPNLKETVEELRRKAQQESRVENKKRTFNQSDGNKVFNGTSSSLPNKRIRTYASK